LPPGFSLLKGLGLLLLIAAGPPLAAAAPDPEPITLEDPHYGEVLFYFYQQDYFPAIVRTLAAQERERLDDHAEDAELLLGGMYLSFGQHLKAAEIFERLLADSVTPDIRDRTWFFLARIWYQRGYPEKARQALANVRDKLPDNLQREALLLEAQILIDAGDYDTAIQLLRAWRGKTEWASYAKFNISVALVRSGRIDTAAELLEDLGQLDPFNDELRALRDKANLALGYALLQNGRPGAAMAPLRRVRLQGPFSNKALLGVGWADAEQKNFQRALTPWMELKDRNLLDSAVQEVMLAVPYAMAQLDSIAQAADHYLNAIEAFGEESARLDRTIARIETGEFFDAFLADQPLDSSGWYWHVESLPDAPESRYLFHLLATHEFQEGLKNYRDLHYLRRNLDNWQRNIDVYADMLEARESAYAGRLPVVESALAQADVDRLVEQKLELDSALNNIEASGDWLALATPAEVATWGEILGLEQTPALQSDIPEALEARDKIRLLKGALQWQLERDFGDRLWRVRRSLRQAGEALVETQRSRRKIDDTMRNEPLQFADLGTRVGDLEPRLEAALSRVDDTLASQRAFLRSIAVEELLEQKNRLETYEVQARFALAAIYDVAASAEDGAP
jgi:tetratricopeptide (TPR) repeat protein